MVTIIAAIANNRCIGKDGKLPWHIPEDLQRFKETTMGHTVIMGRKTWESIPEKFRPLPGRLNIVVTRQADYPLPADVERSTAIAETIALHRSENLFVIGGADIYSQAMPLADRLLITEVDQVVDGDAFFPEIDPAAWRCAVRDARDSYTFVTYERVR